MKVGVPHCVCSFCGTRNSETETRKFIVDGVVAICGDCVKTCVEIIAIEAANKRSAP